MGLFDDLAIIEPRRVNVCAVRRLLESLPATESELLAGLIDNPEIAIADIVAVLIRNEHRLTDSVIRKHRKRKESGGCSCL